MEIKTRFWNEDKKRMESCFFLGKSTTNGLKMIVLANEDDDREIHLIPIKYLMQYTGLKDINGNEIYGGDIVNLDDEEYIVSYEEGGFVVSSDNVTEYLGEVYDQCEIIGNKYELNEGK